MKCLHGRTRSSDGLTDWIGLFNRFRRDQSGATLVFSALAMALVLGMAGLGFDATFWFMTKRQIQTVADVSVISGVTVMTKGGGSAEVEAAVLDGAARNGFHHGVEGQVITNLPPRFGPNAGDPDFIEVLVNRQVPLFLASLVRSEPVTIQARAVAALTRRGEHCILALDPSLDGAVEFTGSVEADISCGVASNSSSKKSILVDGNAALSAEPVQAFGDVMVKGSGELETDHAPQTLSERLDDPYADVVIPEADPGCAAGQPLRVTGARVLEPGSYCGGLAFSGADVTFEPGVYIVDSGDFETVGGTVLEGEGVTFFFTAAEPSRIGGLKLTGSLEATLIAPGPDGHETGPYKGEYAGLLFVQDPEAESHQGSRLIDNKILGGAYTDFRGAIYFPNQSISFTGGSGTGDGCLQIVARKVGFSGNTSINNSAEACAAQGIASIAQTRVRLVE